MDQQQGLITNLKAARDGITLVSALAQVAALMRPREDRGHSTIVMRRETSGTVGRIIRLVCRAFFPRWVFALIGVVGLAGCVETRDPDTISMTNQTDAGLSCQEIGTEFKANTEVAEAKISKNNSDDTEDILLGIFIWPGLVDFKNADGIEGNALLDRNIYLREISVKKECDVADWPVPPALYT